MQQVAVINRSNPLDRPALIQIGQWQFTIDLPGGVTIGDPHWELEVGRRVAQGIQDAFEAFPPQAAV